MDNTFCVKKHGIQISPTATVIKAHEHLALIQANDIVQAAEHEAARIKEEAKKAYQEEKERGYEEGLEEGRMEMAERTFEAIAKGIDFIENLEKTTVDIIMKSLQRILDDIPPEDRIMRIVRRALAYVRGQKTVIIRVCPQELSWVQNEIASMGSQVFGIDTIRVVPDKMLSAGACILESDLGIIDASLTIQMTALRRVFEEHLQKA